MAAGALAVTADGSLPTLLFATGVVVFVAGFVTVYAGTGPRGRVVGFAVLSAGAVVIVAAAGPAGSWAAAGTVGFTLVPLLVFAAVLARRLEAEPESRLEAEPESRPESGPESRPESGPESRPEAEPESLPASRPSLDDDPR